ncbi:MAG TPA: ribonuclease HIII [Candidatus Deferrimicrobium sp.]|nr:ribonuclease HIII [Candidatus Deferrimicrobium sp.]
MTLARRVIGVDESGKGDFFGPLVVAAFLSADSQVSELKKMGVRDGKLIAEKKLLALDEELRSQFVHAVVVTSPEEYNHRYAAIKNLNRLLAEEHVRAMVEILSHHRADLIISDKFGKAELVEKALRQRKIDVKLVQIVRGETVPQVAAASILARAAFIREIDRLSAAVGFDLPRGAGSIVDEAGRKLSCTRPIELFDRIAKTHFKNYRRIIVPTLTLK